MNIGCFNCETSETKGRHSNLKELALRILASSLVVGFAVGVGAVGVKIWRDVSPSGDEVLLLILTFVCLVWITVFMLLQVWTDEAKCT